MKSEDVVHTAIFYAGILFLFFGFLLLGYQGWLWHQQGHWTPIGLWQIIPEPDVSWRWLRNIVSSIFGQEFSIFLMAIGGLTMLLATWYEWKYLSST